MLKKLRLNVPNKGFLLLHFVRSETNGWEIAVKAVGNVPVTNLQAGHKCRLLSGLKRHVTLSRRGADNSGFILLHALGQGKPDDELSIFSSPSSKTQFKTISSSKGEPDGHP